MKTFVNKLVLFCFLMATGAHGVKAEDRMTVDGVQYASISKDEVCAYLTVKAIGLVEIKETILIKGKNYKTTRIGRAYFSKNEYLQGVIIPNTVRVVEKGAFRGCSNLDKVMVPDENCQIAQGAFEGCNHIAFVKTHTRIFKPDYALAVMDKSIPYYTTDQNKWDWIDPIPRGDEDKNKELDVDEDIPVTKIDNKNVFACIIGNEEYEEAPNVPFASKDAQVFAEYCKKTLGLPEKNVHCYTNATFGKLIRAIGELKDKAKSYKGKVNIIFYYAGHGFPDESSRDAYILPTDAVTTYPEACYPLSRLYMELDAIEAQNVVAFVDACFSGAGRSNDGMMIDTSGKRLVAMDANEVKPGGNLMVLSAASGSQAAQPYAERGHGMFTYYLLNKLNLSGGTCTLGELKEYVEEKVGIKSGGKQTPTFKSSVQMEDRWKDFKFK